MEILTEVHIIIFLDIMTEEHIADAQAERPYFLHIPRYTYGVS